MNHQCNRVGWSSASPTYRRKLKGEQLLVNTKASCARTRYTNCRAAYGQYMD